MKRLERNALSADREAILAILESMPDDDFVGRISFESRLAEINEKLLSLENKLETYGSVALMFGGAPVNGSRAIDAAFTSKALSGFQALITRKIALDDFGSLGARGPIPTVAGSNLAITQLVRGSMGFLLEESAQQQEIADTKVKGAIDQVTNLVSIAAAESAEQFEQAVDTLDSRLLGSLRDFFRTLDECDATIQIVEDAREATLDLSAIRRGRRRLDLTEIEETESEQIVGELLGLLPDAKKFEMKLRGTGEIIRGTVSAVYAAQYLALIEGPNGTIAGRTWRTKMKIRVVRESNKPPRNLYTLVGLLESISAISN